MNRIDGRVALVSGAGRGIGAATARKLAEAGGKLVLTDLEAPEATAAAIRDAGGEALALAHDVGDEAGWEATMAAAEEAFGALHIAVNNAGVYISGKIEDSTLEEWHRLSRVNQDGVFLGTKWAIRTIKKHVGPDTMSGAIVNLSSIAGLVGSPLTALYSMSKAGVHLFSKSAAMECGRFGYNIRVNTVHPGVIATTAMATQVFDEFSARAGRNDNERIKERMTALHPLGRLGHEDDIASGILFLVSNDSSFMTGTELVVDGGYTAQ